MPSADLDLNVGADRDFGAWDLPQEYQILRDTVRKFMDEEVRPIEDKMPHDCIKLPDEYLKPLQAKAKAIGLWGIYSPAEYGGAGLNTLGQAVVAEQSARCRMGAYVYAAGAFGNDPIGIIWGGRPDQIERWGIPTLKGERWGFFALSEPSGGSDPARALRTRAVLQGDHYVLNGTKTWITYAGKADWGIVFARTGGTGDRGGISAFIVDSNNPGISFNEIPVIRSFSPYDVYLTDCKVPVQDMLGEEGQGFQISQRFLMPSRVSYSANVIGVAQYALEMAIDWVKQRETFGSKLADKQAIQWMIADSEMELQAARLLTYQAAWRADTGRNYLVESSIAKVMATETAGRVVDRCIQMFGGLGVAKALPFERWYRELRIKRIGEGPSEVHRMVVARHLLGSR